ncbi:MAG: PepSY domain-containing protein [Cyanobacteria bacterium RM1_2_2]|nr:PepSY domain-containing protein [Cyanobacteria bacterium RM1_2_2]
MDIRQFRKFHRNVAPFILLPMFITVFTGVTYRLGKSWFGLSRDQVHFLMVIHEGEYFGRILEPIYVLLNGLGLLWMLITGSAMVWQNISKSPWFRRSSSSASPNPEPPSE